MRDWLTFCGYFCIQVVLCKFHSVFLSKAGRVLTSGHGQGGRLGHGNELSVMVSSLLC